MAGTGRTQYYNLPIYQAQDKVSDLGTYNQAMTIIDQNMHDNAVEIQTVQNVGDTNSESITKIQADITQLQSGVQQAQGTAQGALNQIQEIVNYKRFGGTPSPGFYNSNLVLYNDSAVLFPCFAVTKDVYTSLPTVTIGGYDYYIIAKQDNANPFNLRAGGSIEAITIRYYVAANSFQTIGVTGLYIHYDGTNTFQIMTKYDVLDNTTTVVVAQAFMFHNSQPSL